LDNEYGGWVSSFRAQSQLTVLKELMAGLEGNVSKPPVRQKETRSFVSVINA
jgi:hypothetical protein